MIFVSFVNFSFGVFLYAVFVSIQRNAFISFVSNFP